MKPPTPPAPAPAPAPAPVHPAPPPKPKPNSIPLWTCPHCKKIFMKADL